MSDWRTGSCIGRRRIKFRAARMRQSRVCGRCDGVGPEAFRFLESRASGPTLRFGAGLERERTFAAVDVAHVGYAVSYAEIHQAVIVWRIVVFADARHVLETCLAQRSAGGSVIGKICLAGYDNPIFARLPAGQFEFWGCARARDTRLCRARWKTRACPARLRRS